MVSSRVHQERVAVAHRGEATVVGVIGAGNVGLAVASQISLAGSEVRIWNRSEQTLGLVQENGGIDVVSDRGRSRAAVGVTRDLAQLARACQVLLVTTTANAHAEIARELGPHLTGSHRLLLVPGRTGGALEVAAVLGKRAFIEGLIVGETSSSFFACRGEGPSVQIFDSKREVSMAAFPGKAGDELHSIIEPFFPNVKPRLSSLGTSFDNFGAMFHPLITLLNATAIQREEEFLFYHHLPKETVALLEILDQERRNAASKYGIESLAVADWVRATYFDAKGSSLSELLSSCRSYSQITAPRSLHSRYLLEDVPTGLVPLFHLGTAMGVSMDLTRTIVDFASFLLRRDFWAEGRSLASMGLNGLDSDEILDYVVQGWS